MAGWDILIAKIIAGTALTYLLYISITCPCRPSLYSCHLTSIHVALIVFWLTVFYFNGLRFFSY